MHRFRVRQLSTEIFRIAVSGGILDNRFRLFPLFPLDNSIRRLMCLRNNRHTYTKSNGRRTIIYWLSQCTAIVTVDIIKPVKPNIWPCAVFTKIYYGPIHTILYIQIFLTPPSSQSIRIHYAIVFYV